MTLTRTLLTFISRCRWLPVLDALPEVPLPAKITFVAAKSQFTPKEVETRDERQNWYFASSCA